MGVQLTMTPTLVAILTVAGSFAGAFLGQRVKHSAACDRRTEEVAQRAAELAAADLVAQHAIDCPTRCYFRPDQKLSPST